MWFRDEELYLNRYTTNVADPEIDKLKWENNLELVRGQHSFMTLYWCPSSCYCLIYLQYTNWRDGEPNNNDDHASRSQDCIAIYSETGEWDDGWCEFEHNFICELEYVLLKSFF